MPTLTPSDKKQCQAERHNGHNAFTLGGVAGYVRCTAAPYVIVKEVKRAKDGKRGRMSLCEKCLNVARAKLGEDFFIIEKYL